MSAGAWGDDGDLLDEDERELTPEEQAAAVAETGIDVERGALRVRNRVAQALIAELTRERDEARSERDEARARIARYVGASRAVDEHARTQPVTAGHWCSTCRALVGDRDAALAALRGEVPRADG